MKNEKNNNNMNSSFKKLHGENSTKYGEFISSFFSWIPLTKQKDRAEELEKIGKDRKDRKT